MKTITCQKCQAWQYSPEGGGWGGGRGCTCKELKTVYIVFIVYEYDGNYVEKVFSTLESAIAYKKTCKDKLGEYYMLVEYDLED